MPREHMVMRSTSSPASSHTVGSPEGRDDKIDQVDIYFSADVETDGPIPGEFSMLSFALVYAGRYDGASFQRPASYATAFETTLRPISKSFQQEALAVNGLDRERLVAEGKDPAVAMAEAADWVAQNAQDGTPVLVAYPVSFDWTWLYWYFIHFLQKSPFNHSRCFDLRTAIAVRGQRPVATAGHRHLPSALRSTKPHTHRALDDAIEQADMLAKLFAWDGK
jgi:DNA polymerase III epsilon subunit-like protein